MGFTAQLLLLMALACASQVVRGGEHGFKRCVRPGDTPTGTALDNHGYFHVWDSPGVRTLTVGIPLEGESLDLDGGEALYQLQGLRSLSTYEIKASYPASVTRLSHLASLTTAT